MGVIKHDWQSLLEEYSSVANLSAYEFCKQKQIDNSKFYRLAKSAGLEIRASVYHNNLSDSISDVELDKLNGHLLGDASLFYIDNRKKKPVFALVSKHKEYLQWVVEQSSWLNHRPIWIREQFDTRTNKLYIAYWLRSRSSSLLKDLHEKWYPNGTKIVPKDLILTKETLIRWFLDDGCYHNKAMFFSTDCFSRIEIDFLMHLLLELGFNSTAIKNGHGFRICFTRQTTKEFFTYVGSCPVACFNYKWPQKDEDTVRSHENVNHESVAEM